MGYMRHHAVVVTTWQQDELRTLREATAAEARNRLGSDRIVSEVVDSITNGYSSFMLAPDGSKEGWDTSEAGDGLRDWLIERMQATGDRDGPGPWFSFAEVRFGDEDGEDRLIRTSELEGASDA